MFQNKTMNLIISVLLAVALWIYVVGEVNPDTTKKYDGIKIDFTNEESLAQNGLALLDPGVLTVDVTVEGKRSAVNGVKEENIEVMADLTRRQKGKNSIHLEVNLPGEVKLKSISAENIDVTIENRISEEKPVKVSFKGKLEDNREPGEAEVNPDRVIVSGAESAVRSVSHVKAEVNVKDFKNDKLSVETKALPVNRKGVAVRYLELSSDSIQVKARLMQTKEVSLKVNVKGEIKEPYQLDSIDIPETVVIKGSEEDIENISVIQAEDVYIGDITKTSYIPLDFIMPSGVETASESQDMSIKVTIKALSSKSFDYKSEDVDAKGLKTGLSASFEKAGIKVTARGMEDIVSGLSGGDFGISVNLSELDAGTHKVKLKVTYTKKLSSVSVSPKEILVTISEE
ncbi:MAG TPA: CdaR family protein [Bacillota bacterium]|nr:CdaR family protein [Bacillota bacterium]